MPEILTSKIPVVALTQEEVDEINDQIQTGELPRDYFDRRAEAVEKFVFGQDVKHDRQGNPIEQGIGSAAQPSRNSIEAYKAHQLGNKFGPEKDFDKILERMEAELAEYVAKQKSRGPGRKRKVANARAN